MKTVAYLLIGIFFGIILIKSEAASWFRIYEMFKFQSFHMYGILGSAVSLGMIITYIIKSKKVKSFFGTPIIIEDKAKSVKRYLIGGALFGLGWALAGACPGPMYILLGAGYLPIGVVILAALLGTYTYGALKDKLPH